MKQENLNSHIESSGMPKWMHKTYHREPENIDHFPKPKVRTRTLVWAMLMIIAFWFLTLAMMSCSKQNQKQLAPATNNTTSITPQEQALVGDWIVKRMAAINQAQDTVINFTNYNNPTQCHLNLQNTCWNNTPGTYESIDGLGCSPYTSNWKYVSATAVQLGAAQYIIKYQSTDSLILQYNAGRYYLKK